MKQEALIAWTSLYIGVGMMALICAVLAIVVTADDWRSGRWRPAHQTGIQKALVIPKLWLRWQLNYLKGAPVILAISVYYAWATGFSVFWNV